MRHQQFIEQSSRAILAAAKQQYICRQCLAQARSRALHTSSPRSAAIPSWKKYMNQMLGRSGEEEVAQKRDELQEAKNQRIAKGVEVVQETLTLEGEEYQLAYPFVPGGQHDYVPTRDVRVLESVGSDEWAQSLLDDGTKYKGGRHRKKTVPSSDTWLALIHHALVEALVLHKHGKALRQTSNSKASSRIIWETKIEVVSKTGAVQLVFDKPGHEELLLALLTGEEKPRRNKQDLDQRPSRISQDAASWLRTPVRQPEVKQFIADRLFTMTGHRLSDYAFSTANTAADLHRALLDKPEIKKLTKTPQVRDQLIQAPNVTVYSKKRERHHKDQDAGRWKLVEEELQRRGLPVYEKVARNSIVA